MIELLAGGDLGTNTLILNGKQLIISGDLLIEDPGSVLAEPVPGEEIFRISGDRESRVLTVEAGASVECSGSCKGGCSVAVTAPKCEGEMTPPSCELDAECSGGCDAQGSFEATCTPPSISIEGNANLVATLETWLPQIWLLFETQGALVLDSAAFVAEASLGIAAEFTGSIGCVAAFGADFVAKFAGAAEASVSVSVSVDASADVGGSTG
jgi:hypothetical protein